ncbi:MAG: hypothetical protein M1136_01815 [Chloroflexi bacterium]|nr:hypothetical protein [Chloroflexota bacterium]MCL5074376.1 hypothetical protein [Chloroflexota bacterium]
MATFNEDVLISDDYTLTVGGKIYLNGRVLSRNSDGDYLSLLGSVTTDGSHLNIYGSANPSSPNAIENVVRSGGRWYIWAGAYVAVVDTSGRLAVGYGGTSIPALSDPLNVYGFGTARVAWVDAGGNLTVAGNLVMQNWAKYVGVPDSTRLEFTSSTGGKFYGRLTLTGDLLIDTWGSYVGVPSNVRLVFNKDLLSLYGGVGNNPLTLNAAGDLSISGRVTVGGREAINSSGACLYV